MSPQQESGPQRPMIWCAHVTLPYGDELWTHASEAGLHAALAQFCRQRWVEEEELHPLSDDDYEAIIAYFDDATETVTFYEQTLNP